jgi:hypothetical protein
MTLLGLNIHARNLASKPHLLAHLQATRPRAVVVMDDWGVASGIKALLPETTVIYQGGKMMQGRRVYPNDEGRLLLAQGDYGFADGQWWARVPAPGFGMGNLSSHEIMEHEDGTITVSPSIPCIGHHDKQWHGYLERGIWREV